MAVRYLYCTCSPQELTEAGIGQYIPMRKKKTGRKPAIGTPELGRRVERKEMSEEEEKDLEDGSKWMETAVENLTEEKKKAIISKVIEVGVRVVMTNHCYKANGDVYLQT